MFVFIMFVFIYLFLTCKHNTEPNSTTVSEGLFDAKESSTKKLTKNEKSNGGDDVVIDPQAGKSCFISSVIENTSANVKDLNAKRHATGNSDGVSEVCSHVNINVNRALQRDFDVLKLDVSILEARLPFAISQNESNIDTLRIKQKDMETIIQQQQQTICKLNEDPII